MWDPEKKRLIRWHAMEPNTKYIIPQVLIIDSEQSNWITDEHGVGCVDFLSKELLDSFLDEQQQPADILDKCRAMDSGYVYNETPEIKTQKDIEDLDWASGGFHDARIIKEELREDGPLYLRFDGTWGEIGWATRLHNLSLTLADSPDTDDTAQENISMTIETRPVKAIPHLLIIKAEKQVYNISEPTQIWTMAFDDDRYCFPVLLGTKFYGYDESVIRIVGGRMYPVGERTTRVFLDWHGMKGDCLVNVVSGDNTAEFSAG